MQPTAFARLPAARIHPANGLPLPAFSTKRQFAHFLSVEITPDSIAGTSGVEGVIQGGRPPSQHQRMPAEGSNREEAIAMKWTTSFRRRLFLLAAVAASSAAVSVCLAAPVRGTAALSEQDAKLPPAPAKPSDLVVHEWGTFLGMSSAEGTALDGMYHEEHALPAFVHGRSRDQLKLPQMFLKGETPVIYFYTKEKQKVRVGVGFPRGIWTQWYPQAAMVVPSLATQAEQAGKLQGGRICWFAEVVPRSEHASVAAKSRAARRLNTTTCCRKPAATPSGIMPARLMRHSSRRLTRARAKPADEYEKFLFYRGLGDATLPLHIVESGDGTLTLDPQVDLGDGVRDLFVIRVEGGRGAYTYRAGSAAGRERQRRDPVDGRSHAPARFHEEDR